MSRAGFGTRSGALVVFGATALAVVGCGSTDDGSDTRCANPAGCVTVQAPVATAGTGGAVGTAGVGVAGTGASGSAGIAGAAGTGLAGSGAAGAMAGTGGSAGSAAGAGGIGGAGGMTAAGTGGASGQGGAPGGEPMPSSGCGASDWPQSGDFSIDVDGTQRTYIVALPDGYDPSEPYKLVFAWHYLGGTASGIARGGYYGLRAMSAGSAIFVAAQGIDNAWPNTGGRDVAFTRAMLETLRSSYCVDEERIFSTGFSYGGIMSNTVGCQLGDVFRAIAPVAGSGPRTFGGSSCTGQVAAWIAHGNLDGTVSFSSGQGSRDHWVAANSCSTQTTTVGSCVAYEGCDEGHPVHWCEFDGGHTQPRFAPEAIWAFFSQF